jgi:hypothetical protein
MRYYRLRLGRAETQQVPCERRRVQDVDNVLLSRQHQDLRR